MSILLNDFQDLRPGWRFLLYLAVFVAALYATGALLALTMPGLPGELGFLALNAVALSVPTVTALLFMIRFVDRLPLLAYGVGFHDGWARDLGIGIGVAATMLAAMLGVTAILGDIRITLIADAASFAPLAGIAAILLVSAANEELLFRGYLLQVLMKAIGAWPGIIFMSAVFGLGHHLNPNATWLGTANTFLAGILLCLAYVRTRSLWLPYGIHIGWNLGLGPILGFTLSGIDLSSIWNTEAGGGEWWTGGEYGPEAGLLVTAVMLAATLAMATTRRLEINPSLRRLLEQHAEKLCGPGGLMREREFHRDSDRGGS